MPPNASTLRYTKKRPRDAPNSDSDIEIVSSNIPAKTKVEDDETSNAQVPAQTKSGRERKPSAKARQNAEDHLGKSPTSVPSTTVKKNSTSLVLKALENPLVAPDGAISDDDDLPEPGSIIKKKIVSSEATKSEEVDLEDVGSPVKIVKTVPSLKSADNKKVYDDESKNDGVIRDDNLVVSSDRSFEKSVAQSVLVLQMAERFRTTLDEASAKSPAPSDDNQSVRDDEDDDLDPAGPVTDKEFQHPDLGELYVGLPRIKKLAQVISYKLAEDDEVPNGTFPMDKLFRNVAMQDLTCIFQGLSFVRRGRFVNMARAPLYIYRVDAVKTATGNRTHRAMLAGEQDHPVFWMVAGVVDSYLYRTTTQFNKPAHGIKVGVFPQEGRRDVSAWGHVLGFRTATGPVDTEGFMSFLTRTEYKQIEGSSTVGPSSPSKVSRAFKVTYTPRVSGSPTKKKIATPKDFPFERYFEERVPVYNGIASQGHAFQFRDVDFDTLTRRPVWQGDGEIPEGSIVAVGYTLHTWGEELQNISPNLVSLIMLHEGA
ncbi:hypothetical protein BDN72DRAFT_861388 [Pluteus cervinus]|uniref:Uncharacterized protein n=1 Tax=Pluteus cervinus TaxID=181527 RepID=A0ACD3AFK3_9AGAR|nr:hypothetical protein BDN72DRAFT_861388 [Pluteus cervinus]